MPQVKNIYDLLLSCCRQIPKEQFTTKDVVEAFKGNREYQAEWNSVLNIANGVEGGEGCGSHYSANVYIGQMLKRLAVQGRIVECGQIPAPSGWGYHTIASYRNNP
jgi:hypothetical protein